MNRQQRAQLAEETVAILNDGMYLSPNGEPVLINDVLHAAITNTVLYRPTEYDKLLAQISTQAAVEQTMLHVSNRTTLDAAQDLADVYPAIACLNFASAKNPGGGFLSGSQAQEESLARSSGLYATLQTQPNFYAYHRRGSSSLYSDHVIFSPNVPVFRDDDGTLLNTPWFTSFITAAAVNAGAVRQNEPAHVGHIIPTMEQRTRMVLGVAALHKCDALVLGAWGCGVFQNDPATIATIFKNELAQPRFRQRFRHIEFAVYDSSPQQATFATFKRILGS